MDDLLGSLIQARAGLKPLTRFVPGDLETHPVGEVATLPGRATDGSATHRLAVAAAREAAADAGLDGIAGHRIGVVLGTTTGGIAESEQWFLGQLAPEPDDPDPGGLRHHLPVTVTRRVGEAVGADGPHLTLSTACSSGANAITVGADLLATRDVDAVLVGGADALCRLTYFGFCSLRLMSADPCRPFDAKRNGLSLGEAGAFLVLERHDDAARRGASIHARVAGSACTCDAYHATAPEPEGRAVIAAVHDALARAGLEPDDIAYINAHGTATPANDRTEAKALRAVFADALPPVSASKSFLGHTLGAAGAIEAIVTVLAVREGLLPATLNTTDADASAPHDLVLGQPRAADVPHALSTSFAFGGNNAAIVISRADVRGGA